jgi:hypothetical protein
MSKAPHRARAFRVIPAGALLSVLGVLAGPGCGTDAVGIDDCREIERARCEAAAHCGVVDDVEECQRFYRDHCLHGLSVESPGAIAVENCVMVIQRAGECARDNGGVDARLTECGRVSDETVGADEACDLVLYPERAAECRFLTPNPPEPSGEGGSAGEGGAPGGNGTAGESGAAGQAGAGGQGGS